MNSASSHTKRLIGNSGVAIVTNGWSIAVSLLAIPILLAGLGTDQFGAWSLLQAFSGINGWVSVLDLGLTLGSARWIAAALGSKEADRAMSGARTAITALLIVALMMFLMSSLAALVTIVSPGSSFEILDSSLFIIILLVGTQAALDIGSRGPISALEGLQRLDLSRLSDAIRRTGYLLSSSATALLTGRLVPTLMSGIVWSLFALVPPLVFLRRVSPHSLGRSSWETFRSIVSESRALVLLRPLGVLNRTMDKFILGSVSNFSSIGALEVAGSLQSGANAMIAGSTDAVIPSAAYASQSDKHSSVSQMVFRMTRLSLAFCAPILTPLVIAPERVLNLWLGRNVPPLAASFTCISCLALFITALVAVVSNSLVGLNKSRAVTTVVAISAAVNLATSVVLAILVGPIGVAYGTLSGSIVSVLLFLSIARSLLGLRVSELARQAWLPGLAPSAAFALLLIAIFSINPNSLLVRVVLGLSLVLLLTILTLTTSLTPSERGYLKNLLRRLRRFGRG